MAFVYKASPEHSRRLRELTGMPDLAEVVAYDSEEGGGEFPDAIFDGGVTLGDLDPNVRSGVQEVIEEIASEYGLTVKFVAVLADKEPEQPEQSMYGVLLNSERLDQQVFDDYADAAEYADFLREGATGTTDVVLLSTVPGNEHGATAHRPTVTWQVDVFEEEADLTDARQVAEAAYEKYQTDQMRPIVTVALPNGTKVDVDLEESPES